MKNFLHNTWKHRAHVVMALPAFGGADAFLDLN